MQACLDTSQVQNGLNDAGVVKVVGLSKLIPVSRKLGSVAANTLTDSIHDTV
jgi:hypothetical protein